MSAPFVVSEVKHPTYVGQYQIGGPRGLGISMTSKPPLWHRWFMRLLLGITWREDVVLREYFDVASGKTSKRTERKNPT
jgi:hypothetical protein